MARDVFLAHNYPVGTELTALNYTKVGGTSSFVQEISPGRNYYQGSGSQYTAGRYRSTLTGATEIEVLFVANYTPSELSRSYGYRYAVRVIDGNPLFVYNRDGTDSEFQNELQGATFDSYTYTAPDTAIPSITKAFAKRIRYNSVTRDFKARVWGAAVDGLEAAEPTSVWHHDGIVSAGDAGAAIAEVVMLTQVNGLTNLGTSGDFTALSIGTGGESAVFPSNTQTVTTPSAPVISNITDTSADVAWT